MTNIREKLQQKLNKLSNEQLNSVDKFVDLPSPLGLSHAFKSQKSKVIKARSWKRSLFIYEEEE